MQGENDDLKGNHDSSQGAIPKTRDKSSSEDKFVAQGARPKVRGQGCSNGSASNESTSVIQNGFPVQRRKNKSMQNGASCSSSMSLSSSSSSSVYDMFNAEGSCSDDLDKGVARNRMLLSEESESTANDKKRKTGNIADSENSSGNEGDEGLSGDDCCIYTYKGGQFADLPNSFYPVDMADQDGDPQNRPHDHRYMNGGEREHQPHDDDSNAGSSPEMDYLEMDFDPGPSLEQDSEDDIVSYERKTLNDSPVPDLPSERLNNDETDWGNQDPQPGPSNEDFYVCSPGRSGLSNCNSYVRTRGDCVVDGSGDCDVSKPKTGEDKIESEDGRVNSRGSQSFGVRRLDRENSWTEHREPGVVTKGGNDLDARTPFDGVMLWTEQEAISKQVTLVSSEVSCGATAVINVMSALKMRFSNEKVKEGISTRLRSDSSSIPQYLVSRSFAGVAHENLIRGIHHASHGSLYAKFFQMYPRRDVVLSRWLSHWMKRGAVPIATMNVQREGTDESATTTDTRHHQMIFGVNSKGIYLTNPLVCLKDEDLWTRLTSPSVLKIKRQEIVSRWSPEANLKPLMYQSDDRWKSMNVLGQVVNVIRESLDSSTPGKFLTPHISIPASSGITLVIPRDSSGYEELVSSQDLPPVS